MTIPATHLTWSEAIGKRVRTGDLADQAIPTTTKIIEALREAGDEFGLAAGRRETAAQLVDYFMEEAKVVHVIYRVWTAGFVDYLGRNGISPADREAELARLTQLMAYPDGTPLDREARWNELGLLAGDLANGIRSYEMKVAEAEAKLEQLRIGWRMLHDRSADLMSGILAFVAARFGEARLEDCYRFVVEPYIEERYSVFDTHVQPYAATLERNLYVAIEAMRGHLVGPTRNGEMGVAEFDDRVEITFDPCASGGRTLRGDPDEGTPSRVLEPYKFGVTTEKYDWAWNEEGVCYYCAHCCLVLQKLPIERWGTPVRVVDPPLWRGENDPTTRRACKWTVYNTPEAVPESAYTRIGMTKPAALAGGSPGEPAADGADQGGRS